MKSNQAGSAILYALMLIATIGGLASYVMQSREEVAKVEVKSASRLIADGLFKQIGAELAKKASCSAMILGKKMGELFRS